MSQADVKKSGEKQEVKSRTTEGKATKGEKNKTRKHCFHAAEGSDAESKSELKSFGGPRWETPPDELVDQERPCRTRNSGKAPLTTIWQRDLKPLRRTFGGEAEYGDRT